ncbi:DUF1415 domain-containing protein [Aliidiomarina haloalkalitolerans]|uniref:DUF1415 domain-containing protein n=1 Tax=Aliidiomarina haloalkalitolerans TaxID=859059 RepID=A0A432VXX8_9GAMM|nr:DUF1415 domain-containing protein [Aliidiomarina haloalkalitolerans]RUO21496.1 DUF1415 domain-containing protein [Aliidiomarina haloalkalitolerans]
MKVTTEAAIQQTATWVQDVIVKYNFCPFARPEVEQEKIRYQVVASNKLDEALMACIQECEWLDQHPETETTLLILPYGFQRFEDFLELVDYANELLEVQGYEGVYQLATFHPDYVFADTDADDAANYTNRAPFPILHLLREATLEKVLAEYKDPETIPERNIEFARRKGADFFMNILQRIMDGTSHGQAPKDKP